VSQNTEEFADQKYNNSSNEVDYASPDYYRSAAPPPSIPHAYQQPASPSSSPDYPSASTVPVHNPYEGMQAYRGPQTLEQYQSYEQSTTGQEQEQKTRQRGSIAGVGGGLVTLGVLLLKFGGALITAIISIVIYSFAFGWKFAVGLVALLFIHEMGHAIVMKLKGIPIGGMIFIPLLGAAVTMRRLPQNAIDEAVIGIAGPIAGALAAGVCLWLAYLPNADPIWAPLAYFGFFLNLFNLAPIVPLDGGRVIGALDRRIWIVGFVGLIALQIWEWLHGSFSPWLLFIIVIAATQLWARRGPDAVPNAQTYYKVPLVTRIAIGVLFFGLAAALYFGMSVAHSLIPLAGSMF
jgi:Zn-dependent protease